MTPRGLPCGAGEVRGECRPEIRSRMVRDPYGQGCKTEERSLWCATCNVRLGGQVASANPTGHRYAQLMAEKAWSEHVAGTAARGGAGR